MTSWIEQAADRDLRIEAADLGLEPRRASTWGPCPACRAQTRSDDDPRGPIGFTGDGRGWACHVGGCGERGDALDLLAWSLYGARVRNLSPDDMTKLRTVAVERGWIGDTTRRSKVLDPRDYASGGSRALEPKATPPKASEETGAAGGHFAWRDSLPGGACRALWSDPDAGPVLDYLHARGLTDGTIKRWGLGALVIKRGGKPVERWLTIPLPDATGQPVNVKFREVPGPCLYCSPDGVADGRGCSRCATKKAPEGTGRAKEKPKYRVCAGRPLPLFGSHNLTAKGSPVIVVEGELDVIAADEYGWACNVASGTAGAGQDWPDAWLDEVEPHPHFIIAFDSDSAGRDGAEKLAAKLGRYRASRAEMPGGRKDIGECLQAGLPFAEVKAAIDSARETIGLSLSEPSSFAAGIEDLIHNPHKLIGIQCSIKTINEAWGGLIPGLHVFTGETGEGKTTFTTWLIWDLLTSALTPAVLTSFEQGPLGVVQKLLRMEIGGDFTASSVTAQDRADALDRLSRKGLKIIPQYGDVTDDQVVDAIRYARRRRDCRVAVIDHLDFITRVRRNGEDERGAKERVVRTLATLGVQEDIVIILIVHPNNLAKAQQRRVEIGDLKGASAIRQDCHTAVVIEKLAPTPGRSFPCANLHFDKVRSDFGQSGSKRLLAFDPLSCHYGQRFEDLPSAKKGMKVVMEPRS